VFKQEVNKAWGGFDSGLIKDIRVVIAQVFVNKRVFANGKRIQIKQVQDMCR